MMNRSVRWVGLCVVAAIGLGQASGEAVAGAGSETRDAYAYIGNGGSITMSGDARDIAHARTFKGGGPLLWFRDGGQEYIVRDPDTLAQLEAVWKPGRELDAAESKLDHQHDGLDHQHDQLDAKRDQLQSRRDDLADRDSELADRASDDAVKPAEKAEIAKQRRALAQQRDAIAGEIRALEPPMNDLRAQMAAIQHQLDALRDRQKAAEAKEAIEMRAVFRKAVASGAAKPFK